MDDEYVRIILSMSLNNSSISRNLYFEKSIKTLRHNPGLIRKINDTAIPIKLADGTITGAFHFDWKRFDRVMEKIGYGLYFNDYEKVWGIKLNIYSPNFLNKNNLMAPHEKIFKQIYKEFNWGKSNGENIDVFTYKWGKDIKDNLILRLRFYNNFLVYLFPHLKS